MMKKLAVVNIILLMVAGLLLSGCAKAEPSGFDLDGETLLFKGNENGKGTLYAGSTKVYEGEFVNGIIQGEGKLYADGKLRYEGEFTDNKMFGNGIIYSSTGKKMLEGVIDQNIGTIYTGTGYLYNEKGQKTYYGDITVSGDTLVIGDNRTIFQPAIGHSGMLFYPSGDIFYWGNFVNGDPDGTGTYYDEDGNVLELE